MGVSTDGLISYGIFYEEGYEFPWGDDDIDEWWLYTVCGYKNPFELYNAVGGWLYGVQPPTEKANAYYAAKSEFFKAHPLPVELRNYCSADYPAWALVVPGTTISASRGYPAVFTPSELVVNDEALAKFLQFIRDHKLDGAALGGAPQWILFSYWG